MIKLLRARALLASGAVVTTALLGATAADAASPWAHIFALWGNINAFFVW